MARDERLLEMARIRVEKKKDFRTHLVAYALFNGLFWALYLYSSPDSFPWPVFVTIFWGIGVAMHAYDAYAGDDIMDEAVEKEYEKLLKRKERQAQ